MTPQAVAGAQTGPRPAPRRRPIRPGHRGFAVARQGRPRAGQGNPQTARRGDDAHHLSHAAGPHTPTRAPIRISLHAQHHQAHQARAILRRDRTRAVQPEKAEAPQPPKTDQLLAERLPLRILLCEDNAINQKVAARILKQLGYQSDLSANGARRLKRLTASIMIGVHGHDDAGDGRVGSHARHSRTAEGQHRAPELPVAHPHHCHDAHAMQTDREKCLAAGMDDYLAKPIRPKDVRDAIERWLRKSFQQPPGPRRTLQPLPPSCRLFPPGTAGGYGPAGGPDGRQHGEHARID